MVEINNCPFTCKLKVLPLPDKLTKIRITRRNQVGTLESKCILFTKKRNQSKSSIMGKDFTFINELVVR